MHTPKVQPLPAADVPDTLPLRADDQVFLVTRGGVFEGRIWDEGALLVCRPCRSSQEVLLLVPVGKGYPMLGRRDHLGLTGVHGEPCHPNRWRVAGCVAEIYGASGHRELAAPQRVNRRARQPTPQLALFGPALAA